jgi:hypothetical protein
MARRARRTETGRKPDSSTETGETTSGGEHSPVPSTGSAGPISTASTAMSRNSATSKGRSTVRGSQDPVRTASKAAPKASTAMSRNSATSKGRSTVRGSQDPVRTASKAAPKASATSKERGKPDVEGDRYGRHDSTPPATAGTLRRPQQTGSAACPSPPAEAMRIQADLGSPFGTNDHSTTSGRHRHSTHEKSEESFIAAASSARKARLRHEARFAETSARPPLVPLNTPANEIPEATDEAGRPEPRIDIGPSAAERIRSIMSPTSRSPRRFRDASIRESTTGGVAQRPGLATTRGDERNAKRLREADAIDRETLGEFPSLVHPPDHLPSDAALFFPEPAAGPCDEFEPPAWFLKAIKDICATPSEVPTKSPIRFEMSERASAINAEVLRNVDFDLGRLILEHGSSTLGFGSEFRKVAELRPLIGRHPHFARLEKLLTEGMQYVFERELSPEERVDEVAAMLSRGNHKSAQTEPERVGELLAKDVTHGFTIPLPIAVVELIPGSLAQPLGLVQQWTVDHDGKRKAKFRLTQDLSFSTDHPLHNRPPVTKPDPADPHQQVRLQ